MVKSAENIWNLVLSDLQSNMNKQAFDAWFKETSLIDYSEDIITVKVQDDVAQRHISNSYSARIGEILKKLTGNNINCNFVINEVKKEAPVSSEKLIKDNSNKPEYEYNYISSFNPYYTFETFVVGSNNQFAHAAALSVAKNPGANYNPLFLYGESGLGKTHLLQAIGHYAAKEKPYLKILYIKTEQFLNEFINALKNNTMHYLKLKYRSVDILLIDDIQFLSDKISTQEEFFHTFEELQGKRKQIVITSDRPPKEIPVLTDRLKTRFLGGLLADIQLPNLETREAILRRKAEILEMDIPDDVINYIAGRIKSNIRSLEAALNNLHHVTSILQTRNPISLEMAKTHLKPLFEENQKKQITVQEIIGKVSERMSISPEMIVSKGRHNSVVLPRFISIYLSTQLTNMTTIEIGREFGRDHSTVINARKNIEESIKNDEKIKELVDEIISDLKS